MKKTVALALVALLGLSVVYAQTASTFDLRPEPGFAPDRLAWIGQRAASFPDGTQMAIALVSGAEVFYYGLIRQGDSIRAIENQKAVFEIGSISKVFTSLLMGYAVLDRQISLDQPIREVLPHDLGTDEKITFRQLSNHSSGLPRLPDNLFPLMAKSPDNPYRDYDEVALQAYLTGPVELDFSPGQRSSYSNLGAGLLGHLLERVADLPYETLLQERICQPLGLHATTSDRGRVSDRLVGALNRHGKPTANWDLNVLVGAGGICSSISDLVRFAQFSFKEDLPINAMVQAKTLSINDSTSVALGWHIKHQANGGDWVWHNGGTGGYRSCLAVHPQQEKAVVILSNVSAFHTKSGEVDVICMELASEL